MLGIFLLSAVLPLVQHQYADFYSDESHSKEYHSDKKYNVQCCFAECYSSECCGANRLASVSHSKFTKEL